MLTSWLEGFGVTASYSNTPSVPSRRTRRNADVQARSGVSTWRVNDSLQMRRQGISKMSAMSCRVTAND
jgi:hypothetical protein